MRCPKMMEWIPHTRGQGPYLLDVRVEERTQPLKKKHMVIMRNCELTIPLGIDTYLTRIKPFEEQ